MLGSNELHVQCSLGRESQMHPKDFLDRRIEVCVAVSLSSRKDSSHLSETNARTERSCASLMKMGRRGSHSAVPWRERCKWHMRTNTGECAHLHGIEPWCRLKWEGLWYFAHVVSHMWYSWHGVRSGGRYCCPWYWCSTGRCLKSYVHPRRKPDHEHEPASGPWAGGENPNFLVSRLRPRSLKLAANAVSFLRLWSHTVRLSALQDVCRAME